LFQEGNEKVLLKIFSGCAKKNIFSKKKQEKLFCVCVYLQMEDTRVTVTSFSTKEHSVLIQTLVRPREWEDRGPAFVIPPLARQLVLPVPENVNLTYSRLALVSVADAKPCQFLAAFMQEDGTDIFDNMFITKDDTLVTETTYKMSEFNANLKLYGSDPTQLPDKERAFFDALFGVSK
jgi:hypothetical protein